MNNSYFQSEGSELVLVPSRVQAMMDRVYAFFNGERNLMLLFGLLLLPALLINLGEHNMFVHTDEPRRALVSMEMMFAEDYVTPTLKGEIYLNKPPLYNWIIIASYKLLGEISEFSLRLPVIFALLGFAATMFGVVRRYTDWQTAGLSTILFLVSHRILFYDSFLGLIDIAYSWVVYSSFMLIFILGEKRRYVALFLVSYILAAIGYLMKGLPSILFQGTTLLVYLISTGQWKRLFHYGHFLGIGVFISIIFGYYGAYLSRNEVPFSQIMDVLLFESTTRTVLRFGVVKTVLYLFYFPVYVFIHFFPSSLLLFLFLYRRVRQTVWADPFLRYNILVFLFNIVVYWTSPETRPRYLFMLIPLLFTALAFAVRHGLCNDTRGFKIITGVLAGLGGLFTVLVLAAPFADRGGNTPEHIDWVLYVLFLLAAWFLFLLFRSRLQAPLRTFLHFALILVVMRMGFSYYFLPQRAYTRAHMKTGAVEAGRLTAGKPAYYLGRTTPHDASAFYISRERGEILGKTKSAADPEAYYIVADNHRPGFPARIHMTFKSVNYGGDFQVMTMEQKTSE